MVGMNLSARAVVVRGGAVAVTHERFPLLVIGSVGRRRLVTKEMGGRVCRSCRRRRWSMTRNVRRVVVVIIVVVIAAGIRGACGTHYAWYM